MLERAAGGELPPKHHVALRGSDGSLRYEECLTRRGFDGAYTILYHLHPPQRMVPKSQPATPLPMRRATSADALRRRHVPTEGIAADAHSWAHRIPLLFNADLTLGIARPVSSGAPYFVNADGDELFFVRRGQGVLRTAFGDLPYAPLDYVVVPKGTLYRFLPDESTPQEHLALELRRGLGIPEQWRNEVGQLRMDAPYCHRDFRRSDFTGPRDEGIRDLVVKRNDALHAFTVQHSPLDVVGWDGAVYPWAFPILAFQPRVGAVHLPPTWHGTFAAGGALICSFVPRPLDFHPDAIPCPYPHSSIDVDEIIYYVSGDFTSRTGVGPGSLTLHPRGIPHGPHPGRYEGSIGAQRTEEIAVMLDCYAPLEMTEAAEAAEDRAYEASFVGDTP